MEENIRPEAPPDLAASDVCAKELTPFKSDSSSLTVENSKDMFHQNANARPVKCTTWTDEQHNLYLDHLEASLVKQLHQSIGLLTCCSERNRWDPNPSEKLPANACNASEQFMVLRNGSWQKMNFEENQPILDAAADSNVVESPWISRFRYAGKRCTRTSADRQDYSMLHSAGMHSQEERTSSQGITKSVDQIPVCHQCSIDVITGQNIHIVEVHTEVSDQNFVDEDHEEKSGSSFLAKRLKTIVADGSSQDQIVPSGKCVTEISAATDDSLSEREEQTRHEKL